MFNLKPFSLIAAALSLSFSLTGYAQSANPDFAVNTNADEVTTDDAVFIVEKVTQNKYQLSVWSGMHSHEAADFNGDKRDDFIGLIKSAKDEKSENPPTHLMVILGDAAKTPFEKAKDYSLIALDQGTPGDFPEAFLAVEKKGLASAFAKIGCKSDRAIQMIEEASTAFYLCWDNGKFEFMRDLEDMP